MGVAYSEDGSIESRFSETLPVSIEKRKKRNLGKGIWLIETTFGCARANIA